MGMVVLLLLAAGGVDVSVETTTGETVTGKVTLTDLKMKTAFGSAVVEADKIAQITFGEPDVVVTKGDEEVRGEITLTSLKIETAAGAKTLKRKELKSLVVIEGGRGGATDFNGSWMLTSGNLQCPLKLKQTGLKVTGKYGHKEEFSLEGQVKGKTLTFTLREGGGGGEGTAELWEGGGFFLGEVKYGNEKLLFAAYRRAPKPAEAKPGEITEGQSEAGLLYFLRVPKAYDGKRKFPMIVITHGSNANSRDYVGTFPATWPKLAEDYIIVGVNGERIASGQHAEQRRLQRELHQLRRPGGRPALRVPPDARAPRGDGAGAREEAPGGPGLPRRPLAGRLPHLRDVPLLPGALRGRLPDVVQPARAVRTRLLQGGGAREAAPGRGRADSRTRRRRRRVQRRGVLLPTDAGGGASPASTSSPRRAGATPSCTCPSRRRSGGSRR